MKPVIVKRLVGIVFSAVMILFLGYYGILNSLEYRVQDTVLQEPGIPHPDIFIFGLDEFAIETFGQWPWPREVFAEAVSILNSYEDFRPAVIGIDVFFTEDSRIAGDDEIFAEALRDAGNVVLASALNIGVNRQTLQREVVGFLRPIPILYEHAESGIVSGIIDDDGFVRNALLWERVGEVEFSFATQISMMYQGIDEPHEFVQNNAYMFIHYTGLPGIEGFEGDFFEGSFADIFEPWFDPGWYADAIVLIGPYALGMMDHFNVPIHSGDFMFGVEIHANAIQAILDELFKLRVSDNTTTLIIILAILLGMLAGEFLRLRYSLPIIVLIGVGYFFTVQYVYTTHFYVLPILVPIFAMFVIFLYQTITGYAMQSIEKGKIRNTFMKYVDPKLVNALIESGEADSNSVGKKKHIAVLFVDVRGFTPMTESLRETPELIVETLNEYLSLTSSAVFKNGGSVDKFIGDATMALFNGFVPQDDYIYMAVKAAWDMVQGAAEVNNRIKKKYGIDLGFGIGVHCGDAIVGNLGPSFRKDYTAIGDTVNTAARLESQAKRSQVYLSRDVCDALEGRIEAESVGEIPLKGKSLPIEVFVLKGLTTAVAE